MEEYKKNFADFLVSTHALKFGQFTLKSGRVSPYFFSTGSFYSGSSTSKLAEFYAESINSSIKDDFDIIFGPAYKGIPLAVSISSALYSKFQMDKDWCFDRKEAKTYGDGGKAGSTQSTAGAKAKDPGAPTKAASSLGNWGAGTEPASKPSSSADMLVGSQPYEWAKIILVDDVFTTGQAKEESLQKLGSVTRIRLQGVFIAFDRQEKDSEGKNAILEFEQKHRTKVHSIITASEAFEYLKETGKVSEGEYESFLAYKKQYGV